MDRYWGLSDDLDEVSRENAVRDDSSKKIRKVIYLPTPRVILCHFENFDSLWTKPILFVYTVGSEKWWSSLGFELVLVTGKLKFIVHL